jgi:DNA-binding transcriptional LysR family regulator
MLNDELSDLATFAAVADARSFTRAAAKLGKSQSALSQSVRRLEERLKLRLLTRTTSSLMPTPAGEQLLSTLRPALREIEASSMRSASYANCPRDRSGLPPAGMPLRRCCGPPCFG